MQVGRWSVREGKTKTESPKPVADRVMYTTFHVDFHCSFVIAGSEALDYGGWAAELKCPT
jgi:hypothetical protein